MIIKVSLLLRCPGLYTRGYYEQTGVHIFRVCVFDIVV